MTLYLAGTEIQKEFTVFWGAGRQLFFEPFV